MMLGLQGSVYLSEARAPSLSLIFKDMNAATVQNCACFVFPLAEPVSNKKPSQQNEPYFPAY
eukprot:scaffold6749_cov113-Cylindrotheca_fusiformis.AAC.4